MLQSPCWIVRTFRGKSQAMTKALVFGTFLFAVEVAVAQPGLKISSVDSTGQVTQSTFDVSSGPVAKAPTPGPNGTFKYWDGLASTNYLGIPIQMPTPSSVSAPPNPQIAVGPDDVLTVVNRTIARYPNPNAAGNVGATNPYLNPPTHYAWIDTWIGDNVPGLLANLCPSQSVGTTCFLDNVSIRYDQLQGRFVVLMTVSDVEYHLSNWVLLVSRWANFACSTTGGGPAAACPFTSDIFTPPIVSNFGGPSVGGLNSNWVGYVIPINVFIPTGGIAPINGLTTAGAAFCVAGGQTSLTGATGVTGITGLTVPGINAAGQGWGGSTTTAPTGGGTPAYSLGPGNPPLTPVVNNCTNYFPTASRFGIDNDNLILTAPVLDQTQTVFGASGSIASPQFLPGGAYAGTRVTTVPKMIVYNGTQLPISGGASFGAALTAGGNGFGAVNLYDDSMTGTLTGCGSLVTACGTMLLSANPLPGISIPTGPPLVTNPITGFNYTARSNIAPIFWEPDNLRGRALASWDSQVGVSAAAASIAANVQGIVTPISYLVGTEIADQPGGFLINIFGSGTGLPNGSYSFAEFYVQPIVFSCPGTAIFSAPAGVTFCGTAGALGTQVPDLPALGVMTTGVQQPRDSAKSLVQFGDPQLVGQGPATSLPLPITGFGGSNNIPGSAPSGLVQGTPRLYVGDSRPQQVIFREGLLYVARAAMSMDLNYNTLNTSTVVYDIIKQSGPACQANGALGLGAPGPFCTVPASCASNTSAPGCQASPYSPNGVTIPNPVTVLETQWYNGTTPIPCPAVTGYSGAVPTGNTSGVIGVTGSTGNLGEPTCDANGFGFYAPMYDTPADVIGGLATSANNPISPISLFPWLEKLFVGMTTGGTSNLAGTFATNNPSLWDFRPGDDAYDNFDINYLDPVNGRHKNTTNDPFGCNFVTNSLTSLVSTPPGGNATCAVIPFGTRGGASTDPNDGSLWLYGAFAKKRLGVQGAGPGQWGTSLANYALDFPATDAYNNGNQYFADVPSNYPFFTWIQVAKNIGIAVAKSSSSSFCSAAVGSIAILPPPVTNSNPPGSNVTTGPPVTCGIFGPTDLVTRSEMARWIMLAQMDQAQVIAYLQATGGMPNVNSNLGSSFSDDTGDPNITYIEALYRRGYTKGCSNTLDALRKYCPTQSVTRAQMAVFIIRAKMNNVFPTSLSGIPLTGIYGDNFGTFLAVNPNGVAIGPNGAAATGQYFNDEPVSDPYFLYIQKMRELRISNGTGTGLDPTNVCAALPCYSPNLSITRQEIATFIIRAFFL